MVLILSVRAAVQNGKEMVFQAAYESQPLLINEKTPEIILPFRHNLSTESPFIFLSFTNSPVMCAGEFFCIQCPYHDC